MSLRWRIYQVTDIADVVDMRSVISAAAVVREARENQTQKNTGES